jgi:hypothetical protein
LNQREDNASEGIRIYPFCCSYIAQGGTMLILLIILLLLAVGAFPSWPYSRSWGYYPTGGLGLILLIVLIVVLFNGGL